MYTTVKQKQWQLYFLGYLKSANEIDGIWGPVSEGATRKLQREIFLKESAWDGVFGPDTQEKSMEIVRKIQNAAAEFAGISMMGDGLAGRKTMEAVKACQRLLGREDTGIADPETREAILRNPAETKTGEKGTFWDNIEYFTREEFRCRCGGKYCSGYPAEMQEQVVQIVDAARKHFGRPGHVVSGLRCRQWNRIQGGVENSQHMYGEAVDFRIEGVSSDRLLNFVQTMPHRYAYPINGVNVHVDIPKRAG